MVLSAAHCGESGEGWLKADYLLALCKAEKIVHMCLPKQKGSTKSKKKADWGYRFQSWRGG